jgi:type VI secretion system protein ImpG
MAIVSVAAQKDLAEMRLLPAGTALESEPVSGEPCSFRTTQPVELWPIEIESAALTTRPTLRSLNPRGTASVLRLTLRCLEPEQSFNKLAPDTLRFFIRGPKVEALRLYELIFNNTVAVAVADSSADYRPALLDVSALRPVGFAAEEGMLPYRSSSALSYRLLTEYFAFPSKFLFFEVTGLAPKLRASGGRTFEIHLYLNRAADELERTVSAASFALGCTPVVNLFDHRAEGIQLTQTTVEYPIVPDSRRATALEIYSVDPVTLTTREGEVRSCAPLFGLNHAGARRRGTRFWHATRRASGSESGTEMHLSFVDLDGAHADLTDGVASVELTCFNRDLPEKLPFGGGRPHLRLLREMPGVASVTCLTEPTSTLRLPSRKEGAWRLISHLTLNHLSLSGTGGADALREILRLYDFRDEAETRAMIDSVLSVRCTRGTARAPEPSMGALCHGLDVTIEFDEQRASISDAFLLASVLERFIALYTSINAFTRLTATIKGRSGVLRTWAPRAGNLTLL